MFGNIVLKQLVRSKLKDVPKEEQDRLLSFIEHNPKLFRAIAEDAKRYMGSGKDQMSAIMEAVRGHKEELRKLTN